MKKSHLVSCDENIGALKSSDGMTRDTKAIKKEGVGSIYMSIDRHLLSMVAAVVCLSRMMLVYELVQVSI